jgi:hypothetical protein
MAGESRDMTGWFSFKMYSETGTYSVLSFYLLYVYFIFKKDCDKVC